MPTTTPGSHTGREAPRPGTAGLRAALASALLLAAGAAHAHKASDAYLGLQVDGTRVEQRLDIAWRDLDRELTLDQNDDGQLQWGEVRPRWPEIEALADAGVRWLADGQPCQPLERGTPQITEHSDGTYAVLTRRWQCPAAVRSLTLQYHLFAASDPTHRGILRIDRHEPAMTLQTAVLVPETPPLAGGASAPGRLFPLTTTGADRVDGADQPAGPDKTGLPRFGPLASFVTEGVHHILIGTDHILFLLALLLPAVLTRRPSGAAAQYRPGVQPVPVHAGMAGAASATATLTPPWAADTGHAAPAASTWQAAPALQPALLDVVRVVSAFTLAHSITLALAVLDVLNPPSRAVEAIIAASVVFAALNNIRPMVGEGRWRLTFAFGLVHGFGFAGALKDLGLDNAHLATSLLGFNLGVELGQLAIVALFLPIAWQLRATRFYQYGLQIGGSLLIALLAAVWLVERAFDLHLLPS